MPLLTLAIAISALYLYKLDGVGLLLQDEPRYAAIGRAMAQTGDLVTPRLWGSPWFEKPPLLYWMTAAGTVAGLDRELAARLPVVLLSLGFLIVSFVLLRAEFGSDAAAVATALLATSAGWLAYSQLCLTDLPLAVFFSLAVFLSLPLLRAQPEKRNVTARFVAIGASLGLGALAKGLVPIALALPFFWFLRSYWREWWLPVLSCAVVAAPWYWEAYARNGYPFVQELFLKHHFERLYSPALQHVQPWYYYVPVLFAGLFPWAPLFALLLLRGTVWDARRRFLGAVVIFGFVVFSASLNKLPGYLLPLVPSLFALIGATFETKPVSELSPGWLAACALLIGTVPVIAHVLPDLLSSGRFSVDAFSNLPWTELLYLSVPIVLVFLTPRSWVGFLLVLCVICAAIYLKEVTYPVLDEQVSARGMWRKIKGISDRVCDGGTNRAWLFGLNFYRDESIPVCGKGKFDFALRSYGRTGASVEPLK